MTFAQVPGNMNYQAVIKDASGNILSNTDVQLAFIITDGTNDYYSETQTLTTDASGIVNVKVGEGTPTNGTWNDIDWTADNLGMQVKIYNGLTWDDLGNTVFSTVPFAMKTAYTPIAMGYITADNDADTTSIISSYGIDSCTVNNNFFGNT